jgi:hypothetical protein
MSSPVPVEEIPKEEEIEETEDEIEDIEETEDEIYEDDEEFDDEEDFDGEEDFQGEEDFGEMFDNGVDLAELLTATLATEDGDTVCTALVTIGEQLATQNKILLKMLSTLSKKVN